MLHAYGLVEEDLKAAIEGPRIRPALLGESNQTGSEEIVKEIEIR